jgi:hypothetical protein
MTDIKLNLGAPASPSINTPASTPGAVNIKIAGPAVSIPSATAAPAGPAGPNIFSQQQVKTEAPKMLESLVTGKTDTASKLKPILGSSAALQKTLEQEKEYKQKKKLRLLQITFVGIFLIAGLSALYFYSELSPSFNLFGPNTTAKLTDINKNLRGLQTKINKFRYLAAQQDLTQFSFLADQFLDKTSRITDPNISVSEKTQLASDVASLKTDMPSILSRVKTNLGQSIVIPTVRSDAEPEMTDDQINQQAQADLSASLNEDRAKLAQSSKGTENISDLRMYDNAIRMVGNQPLLSAVSGLNIEKLKTDLDDFISNPDAAKRKTLQDTFGAFLTTTKGDISSIGAIKNKRINWSSVITQIKTVTTEVDPYFDQGVYDIHGGIVFSGYEFETASKKIVVSGMAKTDSGDNFTLLSKLIDALESSEYFKNVSMRSFSKAGKFGEGFKSNFKIDFDLETGGTSAKNKAISLTRKALFERIGKKRLGVAAPTP